MKKDRGSAKSADITRRQFVLDGGLIVAGAALGLSACADREARAEGAKGDEKTPEIPRKTLGRTGIEVSVLGLGTALLGHQNDNKPEIPKLVGVFSEALDRGINYIDTARMYGGAETALKEVLKGRRDKVVVATKVWAETADQAEKLFHESLQVMDLDHVDVLHLHSSGDKSMEKVMGKGGSWEFLEKAKAAGKTRFLGMTGHSRPANFLPLIETGKVDVLMVALNFVDHHIYGFEEKVLPAARKHKTGILAMKVYGGVKGGFPNYPSRTPHPSQMDAAHHTRSIAYAKSLEGVTGMVIGVHSREQLLENIRRVVETPPLSGPEVAALLEEGKKLAPAWKPRFGPAA